ncbi:MAG: putative DsbA family dithiol-disulfide isomerase [Oceanicoccus sp.]|jgi:predicted DsbA family dithiol-disulfide isomerase
MNENTAPILNIDIVSDVVCPWCTIGYQRLQAALTKFPELNVKITFQPFELNPAMPPEGQNVNEHIAEKYGSNQATIDANRKNLRELGESEGVKFDTHSDSRIYNTFLAHKLLLKTEGTDAQKGLKLALFDAYFAQRKDISNPEVLIKIALENGFTLNEANETLADETLSQLLREKEQYFIDRGISAVPAFIFNNQYQVSGAQDPTVLGGVISQIIAESSQPAENQ